MKKFLVAALLLLMVGSTSLAFAWWDSLETQQENITIGIGEGVIISHTLTQDTETLVPSGVVMKTGDVTEIVVTFNVQLDRTDLVDPLNLAAVVSNVAVNGNATLGSNYIVTVVSNPGTIQNAPVTVTVTVSLNMNSSTPSADVTAVKNQNITFDVTFTATQQ